MSTPLVRYMDAVVDALLGAGIGVRDHCADDRHPRLISIDLDPVSAVRRPIMAWTPETGWQIAMLCREQVRPATIRFLAAGPVPFPSQVSEAVTAWLADPGSLTDEQPVYETVPRLLTAALADAAGTPR